MIARRRSQGSTALVPSSSAVLFVVVGFLLGMIALSHAERVYDEVVFDAKTCDELNRNNFWNKQSYTEYFDVCGVMEFCEDPDAVLPERNSRRLNHVNNDQYPPRAEATWEADENFAKEAELAEHHNDEHHSDRNYHSSTARFGWKVPNAEKCLRPGPILRLERGLKHGLFVKGSGGNSTNLHFHGLHTAGHGNGDDILRKLQGNDTIIYEIDLPADKHMGGTHWYHSHLYHEAWDQILGGAYGMMIINDGDHNVGTTDKGVLKFLQNERLLVVDDTDGTWVANGKENGLEEYVVRRNEWFRLRILMVSGDGHSSGGHVRIADGCEARSIAHDGILRTVVPKAVAEDRFPMTSSSRLDLAVKCKSNAKVTIYGRHVAEFKVKHDGDRRDLGEEEEHRDRKDTPSPYEKGGKLWNSYRPPYLTDLRNEEVDNTWDIYIKGRTLNELAYNASKPLCNEDGSDFQYGSIQEWELHNTVKHPLHVHMYPMQVVTDYCGDGHDRGEFYDTIVSDTSRRNSHYPCKVRMRMIDISGPVLVHCHILFHAERGAQGWINVVTDDPSVVQPDYPRVHECQDGTDTCDPARTFPKCSDF